MKKFREFTDDLQRFKFYLDLLPAGIGLLNLEIDFLGHFPSYVCISISIVLLGWRLLKWIKGKRKPKQSQINIEEATPVYISFKDAIKVIGACDFYDFNGHDKMSESMGVTRESYYRELLKDRVKRKEISLYGRKIYSSSADLQKIAVDEFKELYFEDDCNFLSETLRDWSRQNKYTDLSFNKNELNLLVEKLKHEINVSD